MYVPRACRRGKRLLSLLLSAALLSSLLMVSAAAEGTGVDLDDVKGTLDTALSLGELFAGGSGTRESPYRISNEEQLIYLQMLTAGGGDLVQSEYQLADKWYYQLISDIALTAPWSPIGAGAEQPFTGSFDGGGHTISGLNLTLDKAADGAAVYAGLFGYTNGAVIQNLTVSGTVSAQIAAGDSAANTALYAGGIVAYAVDTELTNCTAGAVTITANNADTGFATTLAGGVAGYVGVSSADVSRTVSNCSADAGATVSVTGADGYAVVTVAGGVIGMAEGVSISGGSSAASVALAGSANLYYANDVENYLIQNYADTAGGFVGAAVGLYTIDTTTGGGPGPIDRVTKTFGAVTKRITVTGCTSTAAVRNQTAYTGTSYWAYGGGVVGTAQFADVSDCAFGGSVTALCAGGVVGMSDGANTVSSCTLQNGANVTGQSDASVYGRAGGIVCKVGNSNTNGWFSDFAVSGCATEAGASVSGISLAGGIVISVDVPGVISDCTNYASVSIISSTYGGAAAAGVAVMLSDGVTLRSCANYGPVTTTCTAGGVVGRIGGVGGASVAVTVADCFNAGEVSNINTDPDTLTSSAYMGGIVGFFKNDLPLEGCINTGDVSTVIGDYVGGVVGQLYGSSMYNCTNTGAVSGGGANCVGGLVGSNTGGTVLNSYNTGAVSGGVTGAGGVAGSVTSSATGTTANCYSAGTVTSAAANVGAVAGRHTSGTVTNCYALSGSAEALEGGSTGTSLSFFSADQTLSAPVTIGETEYANLLDALNAYVAAQADGTSLFWGNSDESAWPVHSDEVAALPGAPNVPVVSAQVNGAPLASGGSVAAGSTVTLTASVEAVEDAEILYQWYSGVNGTSVDTLTRLENATGDTYTCTVADDASGPQYYYVEVVSRNQYGTSAAVISGAFTFTAMAEGKWYPGVTEEFAGSGTASDPYVIDTSAKLAMLAQQVNGGTSYAGKYFQQTADLDLNGQLWTAIGTEENPFAGIYDGGGRSITGLYSFHEYSDADGTEEYHGVFGAVSGTVKDLTVSGALASWLNTTWEITSERAEDGNMGTMTDTTKKYYVYMGGVAARLLEGGSVVDCAVEDLTVTAVCAESFAYWMPQMGGVVGSVNGGTVSGCTAAETTAINNSANATGASAAAGGIVGRATGVFGIERCSSAANVSGYTAGGIVGGASGSSGSAITQCENTGSVCGFANAGGLAGSCTTTNITGSGNSGAVSASGTVNISSIGGLAGSITGSAISNSWNTGAVAYSGTKTAYCGGLAGQLYLNAPVIYNCYNTGDVSGTYAGGLAGYLNYGGELSNCYSTGAVSGTTAAGGLVGGVNTSWAHTLSHCYFLEADGLSPLGSASGSKDVIESIGSFDGNQTVTAVDGTTLNYAGELLYQLTGWAISNRETYPDVMGWTLGEDGYPVLSDSFDLTQVAAAPQVTLTDGPILVELNSETTLTATVTVTADGNAAIGTVTYQWYKDGAALDGDGSSGTLTPGADGNISETLTLAADTGTAGTFVYTLQVANVAQYHSVAANADVTVKVNKAAGDTTWYGEIAGSFHSGTGTESDPYVIADADELAYLAQQVNAGTSYAGQSFTLANDLDLNNLKWTPIGTNGAPFSGVFDGGGHTISGLYINTTSQYQGLFGYVTSAVIQNLVVSGSVTGGRYTGGLIGYAKTTLTLVNCGNEADVTGKCDVGGLVGYGDGATAGSCVLTGCYNTGTVRATSSSPSYGLGGLAGYLYMGVTLTDCYNAGDTVQAGAICNGGLVGYLYNGIAYPTTMTNCFSVGTIGATNSNYAGALVGYVDKANYCTTANSYYLTSAFASDKAGSAPITEAELSTLAATLGGAFTDTTAGTVTFTGEYAKALVNGEETAAVTVMSYPALTWENITTRTGSVAFTVEADEGYTVSTVTVDGEPLEADTDGVYTVAFDVDTTVTITVDAVALGYEPKIQNAGEAHEDGSYTITAANAADVSIATVIAPENGWTLGAENAFMVSAEHACMVAVTTDGGVTYTRLAATANADGTYSFSVTLTEDAELAVVRLGDVNDDGVVTALDVSVISQSLSGATTLGAVDKLVADVDNNGVTSALDVAKIRTYLRGSVTDLDW